MKCADKLVGVTNQEESMFLNFIIQSEKFLKGNYDLPLKNLMKKIKNTKLPIGQNI